MSAPPPIPKKATTSDDFEVFSSASSPTISTSKPHHKEEPLIEPFNFIGLKVITPTERTHFTNEFKIADSNKDGFVDGKNSLEF